MNRIPLDYPGAIRYNFIRFSKVMPGMNRFFIIILVMIGISLGYTITEFERIAFSDSICDAEFVDVGDDAVMIVRFEDYLLISDFDAIIGTLPIPDSMAIKFANTDSSLFMLYNIQLNEELRTSSIKKRQVYPLIGDEETINIDFLVAEWLPFWNHEIDELDMILTENRDSVYIREIDGESRSQITEKKELTKAFYLGKSYLLIMV